MKITAVRVTPIAFKDPPLLNASGIHEPYALRSIIEVESDSGLIGLSETYGDRPTLEHLIRASDALVGMSPFEMHAIEQRIAAVSGTETVGVEIDLAPGSHANKAVAKVFSAYEVACMDLQAQHLGLPLHALLGGAVRRKVPFSAYLFFKYAQHIDTPYAPDPWGEVLNAEQLVAQARTMIERYGFSSIKLKAGALDPAHEVACMHALHKAFPDHPLRIDPNANWSLETSIKMAGLLDGILEYYEDPTPGLENMAALHKATGLPLATNMVVTDFDEFRRNTAIGGVQIVLSDHHYWGGLRATGQLSRMCETFGMGLSMHSNSHLGISLMAMTHLAAAVPHLSFACDTHYPWQYEDEEVIAGGKVAIVDGCVEVTDTPGLGVKLDYAALDKLHQQYLRCGIRNRDDAGQMRKYDPEWTAKRPRF